MEVILLERVPNLGQMGDVVRVKDGYARNYLLRQRKALRATKRNLEAFAGQRVQLEAENLERRAEAEQVAQKLEGLSVVILRQAAEGAQLYGSVTARDVADAVAEAGFKVLRRQVDLGAAIKTLGVHPVRIFLHPEVAAGVFVNVARSLEEAKIQAAGGAAGEAEAEQPSAAEVAVESFFEEGALAETGETGPSEAPDEGPGEAADEVSGEAESTSPGD